MRALVAQLAERVLGKDEVSGSIPLEGTRFRAQYACSSADKSAVVLARWSQVRILPGVPSSNHDLRP